MSVKSVISIIYMVFLMSFNVLYVLGELDACADLSVMSLLLLHCFGAEETKR